jgi:hypothetical protein
MPKLNESVRNETLKERTQGRKLKFSFSTSKPRFCWFERSISITYYRIVPFFSLSQEIK